MADREGAGMELCRYDYVRIFVEEGETEAVRLAVTNLKRDLRRVLDCRIDAAVQAPVKRIYVGTAGVSPETEARGNMDLLRDEKGQYRKEAYLLQEESGDLIIAGTDRRGTVYGIYEFCERYLGVSPWYFFGDVPVRHKRKVEIPEGFCAADYPSVEYRGIFINDEEELEHWAQRYMGEETLGVKTYEKIFELLLRLKMNYIWPAMHVNSFNMKRENGELADRMGIVAGTSHCDMLMRSNNREWKPWLASKGYTGVEYDYSLPGRNREILEEYWRESVEQNREFEVSYTLGMRGIHDSGFETEGLAGKSGRELLEAKIALLQSVMDAQERILAETLGGDTLKIFVPYKEVLELYDNGLEVPEDLTLIWVNDNYGYVRRYPDEREKARQGGNGIYYHNSYWAPPGGSYLFICSIPLAHTGNELRKAYREGIRKLWVTNFGAMKPLEQQISFYARLAWDVGKEGSVTEDPCKFLEQWIDGAFSGGHGRVLAPVLTAFDQLTNVRKLEQLDIDVFSQTAWGDEGAARLHEYERMFEAVNAVYQRLPRQERDAFFQMVAMKIHAAYFTNAMYYYADRSNLCMARGKYRAAELCVRKSNLFDRTERSMLYYYNHVMSGGKWNGILTPEAFPPPRTAMHPACMPPLSQEGTGLIVTLWNGGRELSFVDDTVKWLEVGGAGPGSISYGIDAPPWINLSETRGTVDGERRILVTADWERLAETLGETEEDGEAAGGGSGAYARKVTGKLLVYDLDGGTTETIKVTAMPLRGMPHPEDDGRIAVEAEDAEEAKEANDAEKAQGAEDAEDAESRRQRGGAAFWCGGGWKRIPYLGRGRGSLMEAAEPEGTLTYSFTALTPGDALLEVHRFPTLNSVGRIRVGVSLDGGQTRVLEAEARDEYLGGWQRNVRDNVDKLYLVLPGLTAGEHRICFRSMDKYFSFSRFVIYTGNPWAGGEGERPGTGGCFPPLPGEPVGNNLGFVSPAQELPEEFDGPVFGEGFYGAEAAKPRPRPVYYHPPVILGGDTLSMEDLTVQPEEFGEALTPAEIVGMGRRMAEEGEEGLLIEAARALAESHWAWTERGPWQYCNSPSHGETGLAMYLRRQKPPAESPEDAPALHYRMRLSGGRYRVWIRCMMWGTDTSRFTIGLDGEVIPERELYGGRPIWRYSNEQVWKWIPVYTAELSEGEHSLTIYSMSSRLRFEQIYLTKGEELPPVLT